MLITYIDFAENEGTVSSENKEIALWNGAIHSKPVNIKHGKYNLSILARSSDANNEFSHINIYCNDQKIGDYFLTASMEEKTYVFQAPNDTSIVVTVDIDNDISIPGGGDRNVFLQHIVFERIQ